MGSIFPFVRICFRVEPILKRMNNQEHSKRFELVFLIQLAKEVD